MNISSLSDQKDNHIILKILATKEEFKQKEEFFLFWLCSVWDTLRDTQVMRKHGFGAQEKNQESLKWKFVNLSYKYDFDVKWRCKRAKFLRQVQHHRASQAISDGFLDLDWTKSWPLGQRRSRRDMLSLLCLLFS